MVNEHCRVVESLGQAYLGIGYPLITDARTWVSPLSRPAGNPKSRRLRRPQCQSQLFWGLTDVTLTAAPTTPQ
jgi:hypothetical protein